MSRVLTCAGCGAPTAYLASSCAYCRAPLTWHDVPELRAGALLRRFDCRAGELLPGMERVVGLSLRPGAGAVVPMAAGRNVFVGARVPRRDVALSMTAVALHEGIVLGLDFRATSIGRARTAYTVRVVPRTRSFRVARVLTTETAAHQELLRASETVEAIAGVGQPNVLEVRCADSVLSVRVNGSHLASFVDARYLYGEHGLSVGALETGGEALIVDFEAREIG